MRPVIRGKIWKFGDDVDTDQIYPGKYLPLTDRSEMGPHAMEGVPGREGFARAVATGDIIVAGKNFGCGSSREHAPVAIKESGISVVIAKSFARIFYRNSVNMALPVLECDAVDRFSEGDTVKVNLHTGEITDLKTRETCRCSPLSGLELEIVEAGGLIQHLSEKKL